MSAEVPRVNSRWRHHNGTTYIVAVITNQGADKPDYPVTVVYFNPLHDTWWSRPLSEWHRSFTQTEAS